jgi:hypothetical protein
MLSLCPPSHTQHRHTEPRCHPTCTLLKSSVQVVALSKQCTSRCGLRAAPRLLHKAATCKRDAARSALRIIAHRKAGGAGHGMPCHCDAVASNMVMLRAVPAHGSRTSEELASQYDQNDASTLVLISRTHGVCFTAHHKSLACSPESTAKAALDRCHTLCFSKAPLPQPMHNCGQIVITA